MIYKHSFKKLFDDSIIRSVDSIVQKTFETDVPNEVRTSHSKMVSLFLYKTLHLQLPRQCGKTTYLFKLKDFLESELGLTVGLVFPKYDMMLNAARDNEAIVFHFPTPSDNCREKNIFTTVQLLSEDAKPPRDFDVLLFDEVNYDDISKIVCNYSVNVKKLIVSLKT